MFMQVRSVCKLIISFINLRNPLFKLVMSLLKCTGCNNIHMLCIQSVEQFFVNIGFFCVKGECTFTPKSNFGNIS